MTGLPNLQALGRDHVFSSAEADAAGLSARQLRTLAKAGEIRRLGRSLFTARPVGSAEDEHVVRVIAALRTHPGAAAGGHSALVCHDLPTHGIPWGEVSLAHGEPGREGRRRGGARIDAFVQPPVLLDRPGHFLALPVLPVAAAVASVAARLGTESALVSADAAVRRGILSPGDLEVAVAALGLRHGVAAARALLPLVDGRRESPGESRLGWLLHLLGYAVTPQVETICAGRRYRVDFLLEGSRVVIEFDGRTKYTEASVHWHEKRREDDLRDAGFEVVRVVWADLADPERVRQAIERARQRARVRQGA